MSHAIRTITIAATALAAIGACAAPSHAIDFENAKQTTSTRMGKVLVDDGYTGRIQNVAGKKTIGALPTTSTRHAYTGTTSLRTAIPAGANYSRSEFMNRVALTNGHDHTVAFWVYIPTGNSPIVNGEWMFMHQLHQGTGNGPAASIALGSTSSRRIQPLRVTLRGEKGEKVVARPVVAKGEWVQVVESWTMRPGACSSYQLTIDGETVADKGCADMGWRDAAKGLNSKVGIYHGGKPAGPRGQVLYFDEVA